MYPTTLVSGLGSHASATLWFWFARAARQRPASNAAALTNPIFRAENRLLPNWPKAPHIRLSESRRVANNFQGGDLPKILTKNSKDGSGQDDIGADRKSV